MSPSSGPLMKLCVIVAMCCLMAWRRGLGSKWYYAMAHDMSKANVYPASASQASASLFCWRTPHNKMTL
jgi:hypothetical protein